MARVPESGPATDTRSAITSTGAPVGPSLGQLLTQLLVSKLDLVITVLLIATVTFSAWKLRDVPPVVTDITGVDHCWLVDMVFKAKQGIVFNGDVYFTYGPLFQWLWALSARVHSPLLGSIYRFGPILPFGYTAALCFGITYLLLRGHPSWVRALFIIALLSRWSYFEVRNATTLFVFAVGVLELHHVSRRERIAKESVTRLSFLIGLSFLISVDTGFYALIGAGITMLVCLGLRRKRNIAATVLKFAVFTGAATVGWLLALGVMTSRSFSVQNWKIMLAPMSTYRWAMAIPFQQDFNLPLRFVALVAISIPVFTCAFLWRDTESGSLVRQPVFLLSAPLFGVAYLQSALIRADELHIFFALFPILVLSAAALLGLAAGGPVRTVIVTVIAVVAVAEFGGRSRFFVPTALAKAASWPSVSSCPPQSEFFNGICTSPRNASELAATSAYLRERASAEESVFVFPYQNVYGDAADRRVAGGLVQNYLAAGKTLVPYQLRTLEQAKPRFAIYAPDEINSWMIDAVPNLTRNPQLWMYLQSHYETDAQIAPGILALKRNDDRARFWQMEVTDLPLDPHAPHIDVAQTPAFDVSAASLPWPVHADLIRMQLLIRYPFSWHFRKPAKIVVAVQHASGDWKTLNVIVQPNQLSTVYLFPWAESDLQDFFAPRASSWGGTMPRERVVRIRMGIKRMDSFCVMPTSVEIQKLQTVHLDLLPKQ